MHQILQQGWKQIPKMMIKKFRLQASEYLRHSVNQRCFNLRTSLFNYLNDEPGQVDEGRKEKLIQAVKRLSRVQDIPKTKGRLCGGLLSRGEKAYRCFDCQTEQNSVLCTKCFQLDKHVGHDFQRYEVYGGCCDCGDIQKWKQQGFCTEHSEDEHIEINLDPKILKLFLEEQIYGFQLLLQLYSSCLQFQKDLQKQVWQLPPIHDLQQKIRGDISAKVRNIIDFYGTQYFSQLIQFNKAGKFANAMTSAFFDQKILVSKQKNGVKQVVPTEIFTHLFSLYRLKVTPQKVCDLCITLFPMVDFRQKVTQLYSRLYNSDPLFLTTTYTHLSSQLFTSHMMISKLISEGRLQAIRYKPMCGGRQDIQNISEGFLRYYYDIKYLSKLYGNASVEYFRLHARQKMFVSMGEYRTIFDDIDSAVDYYGLDEIYLERMQYVLKVVEKDESMQISNLALEELYGFITTVQTQNSNKFRPQERMFALLIFTRVQGNLNLLDHAEYMKDLFSILKVVDFKKEVRHILANMASVLGLAASMLEDVQLYHNYFTFYSFYLKKSHFLFNSDAILIKILYKMIIYYNKTNNQNLQIDNLLIPNHISPKQSLDYYKNQEYQQQNIEQQIEKAKKLIKDFKNYICIILQAIFSDLPQLAIMCYLQPTERQVKQKRLSQMPLNKSAYHYYSCLLQSEQTNKVSIKQFKTTAQIFFKEEQIFKNFVANNKDPSDYMKLVKNQAGYKTINAMYFKSLNSLPADKYKKQFVPPYLSWDKQINLDCIIDNIEQAVELLETVSSKHREVVAGWIYWQKQGNQVSSQSWDVGSQEPNVEQGQGEQAAPTSWADWGVPKAAEPVKQQKEQFEMKSVGDIPQLIVQLWKLSMLTESPRPAQLLKHLLSKKWINKGIQCLGVDMLGALYSQASKVTKVEGDRQRQSEQRKKLLDKKQMIRQKMAKNTQKILQKDLDYVIEENKQKLVCCLCKDVVAHQHLSLLGFVTFTTGNGWLGIDKNSNRIPIFDSCGHAVHLKCYNEIINKNTVNKVYSICPLCKNPANIQLALKEKYSIKDWSDFWQMVKKVYDTLQYELNQDDLGYFLLKSLTFQIIFKGYFLREAFNKNIVVFKILFNLLRLWSDSLPQDQLVNISEKWLVIQKESPQVFFNITNFIRSLLLKNSNYQTFDLSENFIELGIQLLSQLKGVVFSKASKVQSPEVAIIRKTVVFPELQKNLATINSKYRGKCQQCGLITNQQVICLSCMDFVSCSACEKTKPSDHSRAFHCGVSVFIKTSTGEPIYFMRNRHWRFPPLYEDYMGRIYSGDSKNRQKFELNLARWQQVKKDVYLFHVEQRVRYKENETKQVNHEQIF